MSAQAQKTGACFDPDAFRALGRAYEDACRALGFVFNTYDEPDALAVREQLARHVIAIAAEGEMNPRKLATLALSKMPALEAKWRHQWSETTPRRRRDSSLSSRLSAREESMDRSGAAV